ncbi:dual specificity protein kinase CLK2-like [Paramacrobiotus metropolitanus]|uniref:dual specificity protein kinase CLK2-like n=1 Tax=Paramacrobiotus metropolitanus TaxID=2943436 RepID=UPI0024464AED|nr:dual specificity protein kinase CLK2-like [Paramacrobiotus metropolitanus]
MVDWSRRPMGTQKCANLVEQMAGLEPQRAQRRNGVWGAPVKQGQKRLYSQVDTVVVPTTAPNNKRYAPSDGGGFLLFQPDEIIQERYQLLTTIGEGNFGKVVKVLDIYDRTANTLAMKITRNQEPFRVAGRREAEILERIRRHDTGGQSKCVELWAHFEWKGHYCLVFPKLGPSLYDTLKHNGHLPFSVEQIRHIAKQLIHGVHFIHELGYIHTDLKPENILFVQSDTGTQITQRPVKNSETQWFRAPKGSLISQRTDTEIRIIDFGTTVHEGEAKHPKIQTQHYRAPEVLLELGWDHSSDIFSIGCIMYELYSGSTLFQTQDDREHLAMMIRTLGDIPRKMIRNSKLGHFDSDGRLLFDEHSSEGEFVRRYYKPLMELIREKDQSNKEVLALFDLIGRLLHYQPKHRFPLLPALSHNFFVRNSTTKQARSGPKKNP